MPRINYTAYRFVRPPTMGEGQYNFHKDLLRRDASAKIAPRQSYYETFKREIWLNCILLAIGAAGICLGQFTSFKDIPYLIALIALFLAFYGCLSWLLSSATYLRMRLDSSAYYDELKKDLANSQSYQVFYHLREGKEAANLYR